MRILVLGNNTKDTDDQVTELATNANTINYGLIDTVDRDCSQSGYYHTTLLDLAPGEIMKIVHNFDEVRVLDQPAESWESQKPRLSTYKLITTLEKQSNRLGIKVYGKDNESFVDMEYWTNLFKQNRSFCAYPWIVHSQDKNDGTKLNLCARSGREVADVKDIRGNWQTNSTYNKIREKMKRGIKLPKTCRVCYKYEDHGMTGYRTHDSLDWIARLSLKNIKDFDKITNPYYYELRLSNKCNLMCRMCTPLHSHLLIPEFKENPGLVNSNQWYSEDQTFTDTSVIDVENLTEKHTVYLTGGEPTIMHEVYAFMRRCIDLAKTDFHFTIGTNAQRLNPLFMNLASKFSNMHFSISIDGYGKVNDYIRWKSDFETIIANCHRLVEQGHQITWNHVPTIWGIHRTHELFEYVSEHFPKVPLYLQYNRVDVTCAFKSPLVKETLASMERCKKTILYTSDGKDCTSGIDAFYDHYSRYKVNKDDLRKFFEWNDLMDKARNISMADYIPELDQCRSMLEVN